MTMLGRYWRTAQHLKARQIAARVLLQVPRRGPSRAAAPPAREACGTWVRPARRNPSMVGTTRFRFLSEEHDLDSIGWDDSSVSKLWRYNLHYFDDLNAIGAGERVGTHAALVDRWIEQNPPVAGTAWEPYPTSLRIVNWIKWSLSGRALQQRWLHSLAVQTRWLRRNVETHILGNHLIANAKAMVFAGLLFRGPEAEEWLGRGVQLLGQELDEQILPDGGHFERSPMYHALVMEDLLDLVNAFTAYGLQAHGRAGALTEQLRSRAAAMRAWLQAMRHPDGSLGLFNDAAEDIAPAAAELDRYAAELGIDPPVASAAGIVHLPASGYVRVTRGDAVALLDTAPIGPDYLPGHAHADTLSFELSVKGHRLIVNGGTSEYGTGPGRQRERSTAAHNTVEVAGENSSEVWAGFRVGRRARPIGPVIDAAGRSWHVQCAHDGYRHLPGKPTHRREWIFDVDRLRVVDQVSVAELPALARFIFAPEMVLQATGPSSWEATCAGASIARVSVESGIGRIESSRTASRFGESRGTRCLTVALVNGRSVTTWHWN